MKKFKIIYEELVVLDGYKPIEEVTNHKEWIDDNLDRFDVILDLMDNDTDFTADVESYFMKYNYNPNKIGCWVEFPNGGPRFGRTVEYVRVDV